jgi:23S rRNA (cytosine1962-C5)-methyltransferase
MALNLLKSIPAPNTRRLAVHIEPNVERVLRDGHPWLFESAITRISGEGLSGDVAVIFDRKNRFLAAGLYDPASPIRVRLLVHREPQEISAELFAARMATAFQIRAPLQESGTNGYRLIHGANDGLPGVVLDRYGPTYVLKLYSAAWIPYLQLLLHDLVRLVKPERVVLRLSRHLQQEKDLLYGLANGQTLMGSPPDGPQRFYENDVLFDADVLHGQKTGFFLDQRENRSKVEHLANGKMILNAFSYSGGFSLYAARGGAIKVTDIDQSAYALSESMRHFEANRHFPGVSKAEHEMIEGDVFSVLPDLADQGRRFDLVILDPPAFAKRQAEVDRAVGAYERLARLGLGVLKPEGILVLSSCSSRVTADNFYRTIHKAAKYIGRPLEEIERTGHALDHPIGFKEGAYLKTLFAIAP